MIAVFIVIAMVIVALGVGGFEHQKRLKAGSTTKSISGPALSWPAKEILKEYNKLPKENRPFDNITAMLAALDVKHGKTSVNSHFSEYGYSGWSHCSCGRYSYTTNEECIYPEYRTIFNSVEEVSSALEKQKHALELSKVAHDLEDIKTLTVRMREEKEIITSVTKELC